MHLAVNSIWMLAMGSAVAKRIGDTRFYLFSLVCGVFAALAHLFSHYGEVAPVIGASGAISGQMAAAIRFVFSVERGRTQRRVRQGRLHTVPLKSLWQTLQDPRVLAVLAIWLVTNVLSGLGVVPMDDESAVIAWEAHIGGFVAGLILFSLFDRPQDEMAGERSDRSPWQENDPSSLDDNSHDLPDDQNNRSL
jgi:membrane associated rhomboid family serine protease